MESWRKLQPPCFFVLASAAFGCSEDSSKCEGEECEGENLEENVECINGTYKCTMSTLFLCDENIWQVEKTCANERNAKTMNPLYV